MKNLFLLFLCLVLSSCVQKYKDVDTFELGDGQQNFAIPLINTTISIEDVINNLDDSYVKIDDENFITIVYFDNLESLKANEIVTIPDFTLPVFDTLTIIPIDNNLLPIDLDLVKFKAGEIQISFESPHNEDLDIEFQINNLTKDEVFFTFQKNLNAAGSPPFVVNENVALEDYILDFQSNQFVISYSSKNNAGEHRPLNNITFLFQNLDFKFVQGYFGQHIFDLALDTLALDLFDQSISGNIEIEDAKLRLIATNSMGIPSKVTAVFFEAESPTQGVINFISVLDQGVDIEYPTLNEIGAAKITTIPFENSNSNLNAIINSNPSELRYQLAALINPDDDPNQRGFLKDDSEIRLDVEVEVPLWVKVNEFTLEDTVEFDLDIIDEIKEAEFKLRIDNGLPVAVGIQLFFQNSSGEIIDSLFSLESNLFEAGVMDNDGRVIASMAGEQIVNFPSERISPLTDATRIIVRGLLSTTEINGVGSKFYTDDEITFQLGIKALVMLEDE
jgi:hypothetical protein